MNIAISAIRTKNIKLNRHELITSLQELGHDIIYIGQESNDQIHPDYDKYNVQFRVIPLGRSNTNPIEELKSIKETKKVFKENNIEALIAYGIRTFPTVVIAAKLAGVKNVLCIVNGSGRLFQLKGIKGMVIKCMSYPMLWLSFLLSNSILFQNPDDMKLIKKKRLLWKKNYDVTKGSGVNLEEYSFSELEAKPTFSMMSRITGSKGVNEYIKAARLVKQKYPEANFHLIGPMDDDDLSINMEELKRSVNEGIIILKGKVEDVKPYIKQCRIFVLPSYYPEGVPRSILEAMAMGRPIITTNSPGCKETVIDGVNGFLVQKKDPMQLAEKMIWMVEHSREVDNMGEKSRELCEKDFNVEEINKIVINSLFH